MIFCDCAVNNAGEFMEGEWSIEFCEKHEAAPETAAERDLFQKRTIELAVQLDVEESRYFRLLVVNAELLERAKGALETLEIWHVETDRCSGCVLDLEIEKLKATIANAEGG